MTYKRKHLRYLLEIYYKVVDEHFHKPENAPPHANNGRLGYTRDQLDRAMAYLGQQGGKRYAVYVLGFARGVLGGLGIFAAFDFDNHDRAARTAAETPQ